MTDLDKVPVTVLTGFLGAGKRKDALTGRSTRLGARTRMDRHSQQAEPLDCPARAAQPGPW